jgi:hypothetical protein
MRSRMALDAGADVALDLLFVTVRGSGASLLLSRRTTASRP